MYLQVRAVIGWRCWNSGEALCGLSVDRFRGVYIWDGLWMAVLCCMIYVSDDKIQGGRKTVVEVEARLLLFAAFTRVKCVIGPDNAKSSL